MKREDFETTLNNINFLYCEDILVGDILYFEWLEQVKVYMGLKAIGRILRNEYTDNYRMKIVGNPKTIFLFSNSYRSRKDLKIAFEKVCNTTNDYVYFCAEKYHFEQPIGSLKLAIKWVKQFRDKHFSLWEALYYTSILHEAYTDQSRIVRKLKQQNISIKNLVSLCDVMAIDSYCTQWWNNRKINTITVQHGTYGKNHYGFTHLKSNFLLVHSKYSYNTALRSGVDAGKLIIVGAPQNIGNNRLHLSGYKKKIIGLVFGGTVLEKKDIELLKLVKEYTKDKDFLIYVKLHPGFTKEMYKDSNLLEEYKLFGQEVDIYSFAEKVDVIIDNGSTVFVELTMVGRRCMTYLHERNPYLEDDNIELKFGNLEEFGILFEEVYYDTEWYCEMQKKNRDYLGTLIDPYENYKLFFKEQLLK